MELHSLKPLIVQHDGTLLLDLHSVGAEDCRGHIGAFAELVSSPEHQHSYRVSPLSLWNGAAAGLDLDQVRRTLETYSRYPLPGALMSRLEELMGRWGSLRLESTEDPDVHALVPRDERTREDVGGIKALGRLCSPDESQGRFLVPAMNRGTLKQTLMLAGWPVQDLIPMRPGAPLPIGLQGKGDFALRDYQALAVDCFLGGGRPGNGYGALVLPCGAGKTVIGLGVMARLGFETLILCPNVSSIHQWRRELLAKTDLTEDQVGEYSGEKKEIRPVTLASYQILTWRPPDEEVFPHFGLFTQRDWGLVIYDEVHLLPAPVFRMTAEIQSKHRLGLTATLVREDGLERDVFSLVGPKRFDIPWKDMEAAGWIARAVCTEVRTLMTPAERLAYLGASPREMSRLASCSRTKAGCVEALVRKHREDKILVIGQYLDQLKDLATRLGAPLITGAMANSRRDALYQDFRDGKERILVVSKVANFAIDLPDASVAIQVSGTFGSRQEEAQRLGRIMRPKERLAHFYTLVSRMTVEEEYSAQRQRFLGEQGYRYEVSLWDDVGDEDAS